MMQRILFISGSSKVNGTNWRLARSVAELTKHILDDKVSIATMNIEMLTLPAFDPEVRDLESVAEDVLKVRQEVAQSTALFVSSDEYTGMYSTIFRNFACWLSLDIDGSGNLLDGKRIVLCGTLSGGVGGIRGQPALHQFLVELGAKLVSRKLELGSSSSVFGEDGEVLPKFKQQLIDRAVHPLTVIEAL